MSIVAKFDTSYAIAEAERSKFVPLDPATIDGLPATSRGKCAVLTYVVNGVEAAVVQSLTALTPLDTVPKSYGLTLTANQSATITFNPVASFVEIYNNSDNKFYFSYDTTITYPVLTSTGMVINSAVYFTISRHVTSLVVGSVDGSDIRILAH